MTSTYMAKQIVKLYTQGFRDYEIREQLKTSAIFTLHAIANAVSQDIRVEMSHYANRGSRKRIKPAHPATAHFVLDDDNHHERGNQLVGGFYGA
jgi:hypothetical protein